MSFCNRADSCILCMLLYLIQSGAVILFVALRPACMCIFLSFSCFVFGTLRNVPIRHCFVCSCFLFLFSPDVASDLFFLSIIQLVDLLTPWNLLCPCLLTSFRSFSLVCQRSPLYIQSSGCSCFSDRRFCFRHLSLRAHCVAEFRLAECQIAYSSAWYDTRV